MKKLLSIFLVLMLSLTFAGCEKEEIIITKEREVPDINFDYAEGALLAVVTDKENTKIHDFYVLEDNVELTLSKIDCHKDNEWVERTEDVTDKHFEKRVYQKGEKGSFVCDYADSLDKPAKYILDVKCLDDNSSSSLLMTFFEYIYDKRDMRDDPYTEILAREDEEFKEREFEYRMDAIMRAAATARYIFGDMWGLAETGGAAAGGDVETDGRLYWKAVSWAIFETSDAMFLDEEGKEVDKFNEPEKVRSLVVDGDTLEDVRRAMFSLRFWPEDLDGMMTKISKDRYVLEFDPEYLNYQAIQAASYHENEGEVKTEFSVGLKGETMDEWEFKSYVCVVMNFDVDNECEDFSDFYKTKRYAYTITDAEIIDAVG